MVLPRGKTPHPYRADWFTLNGDGELTGLSYVQDFGAGYGPIEITKTNSVGIVRDAIGQWCQARFGSNVLVAAETMTGIHGHRLHALPHDRLREVMKAYGR